MPGHGRGGGGLTLFLKCSIQLAMAPLGHATPRGSVRRPPLYEIVDLVLKRAANFGARLPAPAGASRVATHGTGSAAAPRLFRGSASAPRTKLVNVGEGC
jgi:hypothetical protein